MLKNKKRVFWEALLLTATIFILGLLLGIWFEGQKLDEINQNYAQSETYLIDSIAFNNLVNLKDFNCSVLVNSNIEFADRIYKEALLLEKYESAGKLTQDMIVAHKKYDLLRTFLWINILKTKEICKSNNSVVVYLYKYNPEDLIQKAKQNVWSKILTDLKQEQGDKIILIPIAVDEKLISLNSIIKKFNVSKYPTVIINNKVVIEKLNSVGDLNKYFE